MRIRFSTLFNFHFFLCYGFTGSGNVYLVQKNGGNDNNTLYAMKEVNKIGKILSGVKYAKTLKNEREVIENVLKVSIIYSLPIWCMYYVVIYLFICDKTLERIGKKPFLVELHYAFQTSDKVYFILGMQMQSL